MASTAHTKGRRTRGIKPSQRHKQTPEGDLNPNQDIGGEWQDRVETVGPPETGPGEVYVSRGTEVAA